MAERSTCDLPYGHFGPFEYLPEEKRLVSGRILGNGNLSWPIKQPGNIDNSSLRRETTAIPPSKRLAKHIRKLVRGNPELEAVAGHLDPLIRLSEAAQNAIGAHDPTAGDLIAFSQIRSKARHRNVPIVATRADFDDSTLMLAQVQVQRRGWTGDRSTWLEVPTASGEQAFWTSDSGTIRQLLFAHVSGRGEAFLAVRLVCKVVILRVSLEDHSSPRSSSPSRIVLHAVATIGAAQLSSKLPVDVAFNPWFAHQIAVLDSTGGLHLWEISNSMEARHEGVKLVASKDGHHEILDDGWARILWLSNLSTVVLCTRRNLQIIQINDEKLVLRSECNIPLSGPIPWILDVSSFASKPDSFVILTTTHIFVYGVDFVQSRNVSLVIQLKVRHFWNHQDLCLRVATWVEQEDHVVAIYSSLQRRLVAYSVHMRSTTTAIAKEPFELILPTLSSAAQSDNTIQTLHVRPVCVLRKDEDLSHRSYNALTKDKRFYSIYVVPRTGEPEQLILYRQPNYRRSGAVAVPRSISWTSNLHATASTVQSVDWNEEHDIIEPGETLAEPRARRARLSDAQKRISKGHLDLEHLVHYLNKHDIHEDSIASAMIKAKSVLFGLDLATNEHRQTLGQLIGTSVVFNDVASASTEVQARITELEAPAHLKHGSQERHASWASALIHLPTQTKLIDLLQGNTLSAICERLVANWITTLSTEVRGTARLRTHEVMRRTAIDLFFAMRVMQPSSPLEEERVEQDRQQSSDNAHNPIATWDLPMRATRNEFQSMSSSLLSARDAASSFALPTPSPTATPSITTASSNRPGAAAQLERLKKYTSFAGHTSLLLPRVLSNVLSHWHLGEDPYEYEWMARSRKVSQLDEDADQEMTEKERERLQRRADRHIRRQRKEAAASETAWAASSQTIDIRSASQPSASAIHSQNRHMKSSQSHSQGQSENHGEAAASQVLSGRHGGRPPSKKRKRGF